MHPYLNTSPKSFLFQLSLSSPYLFILIMARTKQTTRRKPGKMIKTVQNERPRAEMKPARTIPPRNGSIELHTAGFPSLLYVLLTAPQRMKPKDKEYVGALNYDLSNYDPELTRNSDVGLTILRDRVTFRNLHTNYLLQFQHLKFAFSQHLRFCSELTAAQNVSQ